MGTCKPSVYAVSPVSPVVPTESGNCAALPDPAMEARRQRVLAVLAERPGIKYALVVGSPDADPVIVALGIRGQATFEFHVAREKFDSFLLLDLIERHGGTTH